MTKQVNDTFQQNVNVPLYPSYCFQVLPTPQLLSQLRGQLCAMLIAMQLDWADELGIKTPHQVLWIYSILGVLEKPISSDIARWGLRTFLFFNFWYTSFVTFFSATCGP